MTFCYHQALKGSLQIHNLYSRLKRRGNGTWKRPFPCRVNVEYTWWIYRVNTCYYSGVFETLEIKQSNELKLLVVIQIILFDFWVIAFVSLLVFISLIFLSIGSVSLKYCCVNIYLFIAISKLK